MKHEPKLSLTTWVERCDDILDAEVDREVVALSVAKGACYGLNTVGSRVWVLLSRPTQIGTVCDTLAREYAVDPRVCEREVLAFLEELLSEGMIEIHDVDPQGDQCRTLRSAG